MTFRPDEPTAKGKTMRPINRKTGRELPVRKFRKNDEHETRRVKWSRDGSLRALNEALSAEREENASE